MPKRLVAMAWLISMRFSLSSTTSAVVRAICVPEPMATDTWAFASTGAVFLGMAALSTVIKRDLSNMGKFLFVGALIVLVAGIANVFIQSGALMITLSVLVAGIFSAFILYDLKRVRDGYETNYISATLSVYLSIYNVFQALLSLFGIGSSSE